MKCHATPRQNVCVGILSLSLAAFLASPVFAADQQQSSGILMLPPTAAGKTDPTTCTYGSNAVLFLGSNGTGGTSAISCNNNFTSDSSGDVTIAGSTTIAGRVGIGTASPQATLDVDGGVRLGSSIGNTPVQVGQSCSSAAEATIAYDMASTMHQPVYCDGNIWRSMGNEFLYAKNQSAPEAPKFPLYIVLTDQPRDHMVLQYFGIDYGTGVVEYALATPGQKYDFYCDYYLNGTLQYGMGVGAINSDYGWDVSGLEQSCPSSITLNGPDVQVY